MAETKYGKLIIPPPIKKDSWGEAYIEATGDELNNDVIIGYSYVKRPFVMEGEAMKHDFHQYLCFIGSNPMDLLDLGGEAEFSLGEEGEKHIIGTTSFVSIPPGLIHCPLKFTRVNKPFLLLEVTLAGQYTKTPPSG
jgi:hypothetical protein